MSGKFNQHLRDAIKRAKEEGRKEAFWLAAAVLVAMVLLFVLVWVVMGAPAPAYKGKEKPQEDYPKFAKRPLKLLFPGAIPATGWWYEKDENGKAMTWISDPKRKTKVWDSGYFKTCDDPDCWLCSPDVYKQANDDPPVPIRR